MYSISTTVSALGSNKGHKMKSPFDILHVCSQYTGLFLVYAEMEENTSQAVKRHSGFDNMDAKNCGK